MARISLLAAASDSNAISHVPCPLSAVRCPLSLAPCPLFLYSCPLTTSLPMFLVPCPMSHVPCPHPCPHMSCPWLSAQIFPSHLRLAPKWLNHGQRRAVPFYYCLSLPFPSLLFSLWHCLPPLVSLSAGHVQVSPWFVAIWCVACCTWPGRCGMSKRILKNIY